MASKTVKILGWVFVLVGILGFVPGITSDGMLLGIFEVDGIHNIVHLLSGILAILFAKKGEEGAKTFAKVFGIVYGIVAILGFFSTSILGLFMVNGADNILHVVLALVFLYVGFAGGKKMAASAPSMQAPSQDSGMGGNDSMGGNNQM